MTSARRVSLPYSIYLPKLTMETLNLNALYDAVEEALSNFTGDSVPPETIELVATRVATALELVAKDGFVGTRFTNLLESSSTYVQTDLDELELNDYVGELENQLEDYGLL